MTMLLRAFTTASLILSGAIFGFFFAWICSTLWGLEALDPRAAIAAMQAMNASVRNWVFAPAFFGTPLVLAATAALAWQQSRKSASRTLALAALVYLVGGLLLTLSINVPMNEALAAIAIPDNIADAAVLWRDYADAWQRWNVVRTVASGVTLLLVGRAIHRLACAA